VGTLQDLVFHLNRTDRHKAVIGRSIKLPFFVTNGIRILFFLVFSVIVFWLSVDIIDPVDPFKIYKPSHIGILGALFIGSMLIASLFVYRPWCHLFCPFGLAGWVVEKISLVKVSVNYDTCIACEKCSEACPSTVMGAILKQNKRTVPDCFSCYTCREVCPTDSINFSSRKRSMLPPGFFKK
jgi:polyferredoxin